MNGRRFNPPPGWPEPPQDWQPHEGWRPDPSWPPPPYGWRLWDAEEDAAVRRPARLFLWLVAYWGATSVSGLFLLLAVRADGIPGASYAALGLGTTAAATGSILATQLVRARVTSIDFDDATSAMRVLTVGWAVLVVAMLVAVGVGSGLGERPTAGPEAISAVLSVADGVAAQVFGVGALFVIVGDSYTKSRRLLATN